MNSPIAALAWELWKRGRRSAWLVVICLAFCAFIHLIIPDTNRALFSAVFGVAMVLSVALLMGLLNCTEATPTREWNGFPYRIFTLPVPTWKLVALPMAIGLVTVELLYFAWIRLVWTHSQIDRPLWYAVILGAYVLYYQTTLWSLAAFRILRTMVLSIGGVSGILVAALPALEKINAVSSPWLSEERLIPIVLGTLPVAFVTAWVSVARQRHGGGRRQNWLKLLVERLVDVLPRRTKDFRSPAAAQFWFEWRRAGLLPPACVGFALVVVIGPLSWKFRTDPHFTTVALCWVAGLPLILGFLIGKGFAKPDLFSTNLSIPQFLAVRPLTATEIIVAKLKVAALSVFITWMLVLLFITLWLSAWADNLELQEMLYQFRLFHPQSWSEILALSFVGLMVLTWRFMVNELWTGLSGLRHYYYGSIGLQVLGPLLLLLACAIWSDAIDRLLQRNPDLKKAVAVEVLGWCLALLVIAKLWFAVFSWRKIDPRHSRRYWLLWIVATLCLIALAFLASPPFDVYRQAHVYLLAALLFVPIARLGFSASSLEGNRHG
jgi:hypothetical protein